MIRRPPRSTRTDTLFPYTTLFRSFAGRWPAVSCSNSPVRLLHSSKNLRFSPFPINLRVYFRDSEAPAKPYCPRKSPPPFHAIARPRKICFHPPRSFEAHAGQRPNKSRMKTLNVTPSLSRRGLVFAGGGLLLTKSEERCVG